MNHSAGDLNQMGKRFVGLLLMVVLAVPAFAQSAHPLNPALLASKWPAEWIACPGAPARDVGVYYFRKQIEIDQVPPHYWVHVSADNRFLLHVNGAYAGEGPARGDLFHWRFETIDLAPYLRQGTNVIAALVWNYVGQAPLAQMSSQTGFLMQGDGPAEAQINTGTGWEVRHEMGRTAVLPHGLPGYYAAGPAESMDGRLADWNWDGDGNDEDGWQKPLPLGQAATREARDSGTVWELVEDALPPMEHRLTTAGKLVRVEGLSSTLEFPANTLEIPARSHVKLLLDNGVLQTAYPELIMSGGREAEIRLTYSEALYDSAGQKGNRNEIEGRHIGGLTDTFISDGGQKRSFQPLWWRTWRYLQIEITTHDSALVLDNLKAWFSAYPFVEQARIKGDIPDLDRMWQTGWRTARLCAHETYMDAPYWEQLQYVGDTRIQALISYAMTGDSRLARQAIQNIDDSRVPEGLTQSRYPSSLPQFIPTFSLLWVGMLHDYWMYVDDPSLVREVLPHTRDVIDWYAARLRSDGLLGNVKWWEFADWTSGYPDGVPPQDADGGSALLTLQFMEALRNAAEMETKYGSRERAAQYLQMAEKAKAALNRLDWDPHFGVYADTPAKKSYSQQANILAVWLDVAPREQQARVLRRVLAAQQGAQTTFENKPVPPMSRASYYFRFYLSRALEHAGLGDLYVDELDPWQEMLKKGLSTWAEVPDPTRSDCHAWSASPNYDLLTVTAGIQPGAPGFARVLIEPHLGKLTHLEASMPHRGGDIHVRYQRESGKWAAVVSLPESLSGELRWHGARYPLHPGTQTIGLGQR